MLMLICLSLLLLNEFAISKWINKYVYTSSVLISNMISINRYNHTNKSPLASSVVFTSIKRSWDQEDWGHMA